VGSRALGLPRRIEDTIDKLERGDIRVRVRSSESDRILRRLSALQLGTNYTLFISSFFVSGTILYVYGHIKLAIVVLLLAIVPAWSLFRLLRRLDRLDRMP
jgi:hypothetical protein